MINEPTGRPSTTSLFADAFAQLTRLIQTEIKLLKTEISEKISEAVRAIVIMVVSAVLLLLALILILQGIVALLVYFGLPAFAAFFIVGLVIAIAGGIAIWIALKSLSVDNLKPKRSIKEFGRDAHVIKDQVT